MTDTASPDRAERLVRAATLAAQGRAQVVHLRGEPGMGRSTVLGAVRRTLDAQGWNVVLLGGLGPCTDEPFGALRTLVHLFADSAPQRSLVEHLTASPTVDRVAIQVGLLRLITDSVVEQPLALLLDDADRFDPESQQALVFAAGQLMADAVLVVDAAFVRSASPFDALAGELVVLEPLSDAAIRSSLAEWAEFDPVVLDVIVARAGGNPMAAKSLAVGLDADQRLGRAALPFISQSVHHDGARVHFEALPIDLRRALAVVAADDSGELPLIAEALRRLGEASTSLDEAVASGLLDVAGGRVRFTDPQLRAIAYYDIAEASRRAAHRALAAAYGRPDHAVRRAWHLAEAAPGHDTEAARALDLVATHDQRRGAPLAAARALERAAQLDTDAQAVAARVVEAARLRVLGGDDVGARLRVEGLDLADASDEVCIAAAEVIAATWAPATDLLARSDPGADMQACARAHAAMREGACTGFATSLFDVALLDRAWSAHDPADRESVADDLRRMVTLGVAGARWRRIAEFVMITLDVDLGGTAPAEVTTDWGTAIADADARRDGWLSRAASEVAVRVGSDVERSLARHRLERLGPWRHDSFEARADDGAPPESTPVGALSPAEMRVARCVTAGRTNREAADELFVSRKTVDFHLQQIFRKLGIRSRTELAVLVSRGSLIETRGPRVEST